LRRPHHTCTAGTLPSLRRPHHTYTTGTLPSSRWPHDTYTAGTLPSLRWFLADICGWQCDMSVHYMVTRWHDMQSFSFTESKDVKLQGLLHVWIFIIQRKWTAIFSLIN
jgi:hypothetical protein